MLVEDALFAHAGAEDLSPCQQENNIQGSHHEDSNSSNSEPHRDICHFGHCSFLLIEPLNEATLPVLPEATFAPYVFSLAIRSVEPSIRPPIL